MDYAKILSRSLEITRRYPALWLFGVLLALFEGGASANFSFPNFGGMGSGGRSSNLPSGPFPSTLSPAVVQAIVAIIGVLVCIALIWFVLSIILRMISRAALIGSVQDLETSQTAPTVRGGFGKGGDRFWSLLGIAFAVNVPLIMLRIGLLALALGPLLASVIPIILGTPSRRSGGFGQSQDWVPIVLAGITGSFALLCCVGLVLLAIGLAITPFYEFIVRSCVIGRRGVTDSIRDGVRVVRANVGKVILLYLLAIGIGIGFGIVMIPIGLVFFGIPVIAGLLVYWGANSALAGIVVGLILVIPMGLVLLFISGLYRVFVSTVWTVGYLEITQPAQPAPSPVGAPTAG